MADPSTLRLLIFRLGPLICAAPAALVREVIPADPPVRVPGADPAVAGLVNVRGTLLTVVDGRRAAGVVNGADNPESVVVIDRGERGAGIAVDQVEDLIEVESAALVLGDRMPGVDPALVKAVGEHDGRVFALLDLEALLAPHLG